MTVSLCWKLQFRERRCRERPLGRRISNGGDPPVTRYGASTSFQAAGEAGREEEGTLRRPLVTELAPCPAPLRRLCQIRLALPRLLEERQGEVYR